MEKDKVEKTLKDLLIESIFDLEQWALCGVGERSGTIEKDSLLVRSSAYILREYIKNQLK